MAEIVTEVGKNDKRTYHLSVNPDELDVIYRLLRCTKENALKTRLYTAHKLRDLIEQVYVPTLDYETDEALSKDHFGMITFKELEI